MNIRDIVIKHKLVAFECNSHAHFKYFIDQCKSEGIKFSKTGFVEDYEGLYNRYSDNYDPSYKLYALIVLSGYHQPRKESYTKRMNPLLQEFQFYSRSAKEDIYTDWSKYTMVDFSQMLRDSKLDIILKDI